jgi:hypothetical protein
MGHISLEQRTNTEFLVKLEKTATEIYKLTAHRSKGMCQTKGSPWSSRMGVRQEAKNLTYKIIVIKKPNDGYLMGSLRKSLRNSYK